MFENVTFLNDEETKAEEKINDPIDEIKRLIEEAYKENLENNEIHEKSDEEGDEKKKRKKTNYDAYSPDNEVRNPYEQQRPDSLRTFNIILHPYMPEHVLAFTDARGSIWKPFYPKGYLPFPDHVLKHEIAHNLLNGSPYHTEDIIDNVAYNVNLSNYNFVYS